MIQSQQPYNWKYPTLLTLSTITVVLSLTWPKPQFKASIPMPARVEEAIHLPASQTLNGHSTWVYALAISPDNKYLASGSYDGQIKIWNLEKGQLLHTLSGHTDAIQTLAISPDGILASGGWDNRVRLWNLETGTLIQTLKGHVEDVKTLAISSDGKWLASGSADKTIKLWHLQTGKQHLTVKTSDWVRSVSFSPDNQTLASGSENGSVQIWSVTDGKPLHTLAGHSQAVWSVAFSPDGQTLATGSTDKTVKLWQLSNQQLQDTLVGHSKAVWSVAFSPDGQTLASGSGDETVKLWQIDSSVNSQTEKVAESSEKQAPEPSASEAMNAEKMAELNQQLYQKIDKKWQSIQFNETLVYQVKVTTDGKVASYRPVNAAASYWVTETPLEQLQQTNISNENLIEFEVVMKPSGILEVAPIQGWNNRP